MLPEESLQEISPKKSSRKNASNDSVRSVYSSRSSSPLVRQKATNAALDSMSSQETDNQSDKHNNTFEASEESVPKLESVINGLIFKRRNKQKKEQSQTESASDLQCLSKQGSQDPVGSSNNLEKGMKAKDNKQLNEHASFESLEVTDRSSPKLLQLENEAKSLKTKSLGDIRSDEKRKRDSDGRNVISVATSPVSTSLSKFQYTITCGKEVLSKEGDAQDARQMSRKPEDNRPVVCFAARRCKSADNSNKENMLITEEKSCIKFQENNSTGKLTSTYKENIGNIMRNSIDLPGKKDGSPAVARRSQGMFSRNTWASRLGQAHDSGVHSMSMSQNQETFTLDIPLGELSESPNSDTDSPPSKLQSTVH